MTVARFEGTDPVARYWLANCEGFAVEGATRGVVEELLRDGDPHVTARLVVRTRGGRRTIVPAASDRRVVPADRVLVVERAPRRRAGVAARSRSARGPRGPTARCSGGHRRASRESRGTARAPRPARERRRARSARGVARRPRGPGPRRRRPLARRSCGRAAARPLPCSSALAADGGLSFAHGGHARVARLGGALRRAHARGRGRRHRGDPRALANPDLISFAGGFPDPQTFPAERGPRSSSPSSPPQVTRPRSSTRRRRGFAGTRDALASRLESLQGRAPPTTSCSSRAAASRRSSSSRSRSSTQATPSSSRARRISARSWRFAASRPRSSPCRSTRTASTSTRSRPSSRAGLRPEAALHDPRPPEPGRGDARRPIAARRSSSSRAATGS